MKRLPVAAAFHSSLVAQAGAPFAESLTSIELTGSDVTVYANATGDAYPERSTDARELLASQLTSPVEFVACVKSMFDDGVRTFVEVGPGRRLSALIDEILAGEDITTVAVDASSGRRAGLVDLARTLAQVAADGHAVALDRWDDGALDAWQRRIARGKPTMTVPISGVNHVDPRPTRPPRVATPALPATSPAVRPTPIVHQVGPTSEAAESTSDPQLLAEAMRASQASLQALVRLQEQTADVHRRFLESQERTIQAIAGQQGLLPAVPAANPAPSRVPEPALAQEALALTPEPTPEPAPTVAPAPTVEPEVAAPGVAAALLSVVSEKTGYPEEMLELSMGLDADLGIDSIKRVEILSALQERLPDAPVITPEHLGEIQTLGQIVEFLGGSASESEAPSVTGEATTLVDAAETTGPTTSATAGIAEMPANDAADAAANGSADAVGNPSVDSARISEVLLSVVADKTGYPVDMLDVSMNLDADLGIDSIKRVEILAALQEALPEAPVVAPDQLGELRTLSQIVDVLAQGAEPAGPTPTPRRLPAPGPAGSDRCRRVSSAWSRPFGHSVRSESRSDFPAGAKIWVTKSGDVLSGQIVDELSAQGYSAEEVELADQVRKSPDDVAGLIVVVPPRVTDDDILFGFGRVRAMAPVLRRAALQGGALLCSVTCLGGGFALEAAPPEDVDADGRGLGRPDQDGRRRVDGGRLQVHRR